MLQGFIAEEQGEMLEVVQNFLMDLSLKLAEKGLWAIWAAPNEYAYLVIFGFACLERFWASLLGPFLV